MVHFTVLQMAQVVSILVRSQSLPDVWSLGHEKKTTIIVSKISSLDNTVIFFKVSTSILFGRVSIRPVPSMAEWNFTCPMFHNWVKFYLSHVPWLSKISLVPCSTTEWNFTCPMFHDWTKVHLSHVPWLSEISLVPCSMTEWNFTCPMFHDWAIFHSHALTPRESCEF